MAAFLVRAFGLSSSRTDAFRDDDDSIFEADIDALAKSGITAGCDHDRFCPEEHVTRGQMAAFLVRAIPLKKSGDESFKDIGASVFREDIRKLVHARLTYGCGGSSFCPNEPVMRDQMASFLARSLDIERPAPTAPDGPNDPEVPTEGILIEPGKSIQAMVDANPPGTTFLLGSGIHRNQTIVPKRGNTFVGLQGAVLSGAALIRDFTREGSYWIISGQTAEGERHGNCKDGYSGCIYPEQLFIAGRPLWQVTSKSELRSGTWYFDYGADKVYFVDDPRGKDVELGISRHAFSGSSNDVMIANLTIEKYSNPAQTGAIHPRDGSNGPFGYEWNVIGNEVRHNHGEGLKLGPGMLVEDNFLHHNGRLGLHGSSDELDGAWIIGNEVSHNCTVGFACSGWGGGGIKIGSAHNVVLQNNHVHDNFSVGMHTDVGAKGIIIRDNLVENNHGSGVVIEITYDATVSQNTIRSNGFEEGGIGAGVLVRSSPDAEVVGNTIINNRNGVLGVQVDRGAGPHGAYDIDNLLVRDNLIVMTEGFTGLNVTQGDSSYFSSRNNRFENNTYELGSNRYYYKWNGDRLNASQWVAEGQDVNGEWR